MLKCQNRIAGRRVPAPARPLTSRRGQRLRIPASLSPDLKILTVNSEEYVLLNEVKAQLDKATSAKADEETQQAQQAAALLQQVQEENKKQRLELEKQLKMAQAEVANVKAAMETAVLKAAQKLEHRFEVAYHKAHSDELATLQAELIAAQEAARDAEEKALEAVRVVNEDAASRAQEAAEQVANESMSAVVAARGATGVAQLAAEEAEGAAQRSVEQQLQSLALVKDIQAHAEAAEQRAMAAHQQAKALAAEVSALRDAVAAAQAEAAAATGKAVEAEAAAADKISNASKQLAEQLGAAERAFEEFRKVERQRAQAALDESAALTKQNANLVEESKNLRAALAAAEHAVAQADGRAAGVQAALQQQEAALGALFKERLAAQKQELQATVLKEQLEGQRDKWHEVATEVKALAASIDGVEEEAQGQVAALRRAVEAQGHERTYWRTRCLKAEGESRLLSLQLKKVLDRLGATDPTNTTDLAVGIDNNGAVPRRMSAVLRQERLWQFMAAGPRGPSRIACEGAVSSPEQEDEVPSSAAAMPVNGSAALAGSSGGKGPGGAGSA